MKANNNNCCLFSCNRYESQVFLLENGPGNLLKMVLAYTNILIMHYQRFSIFPKIEVCGGGGG